jgi:hypothetical protein
MFVAAALRLSVPSHRFRVARFGQLLVLEGEAASGLPRSG